MKFKKFIVLFLFSAIVFPVFSQNFPVYEGFDSFEEILNKQDDKVYVINFWATWCKPCVKEMPAFNALYEEYNDKNVVIVLVSLDFGNNLQSRIAGFKDQHNIKSKIVILDDPDSNEWIDKVDPGWSGAIPATLIYNKFNRKFYEQEFDYQQLETELKKFL